MKTNLTKPIQVEIRLIKEVDFKTLFAVVERNRLRLLMYFPKTSASIIDLKTARNFARLKNKQSVKKKQYFFAIFQPGMADMIGCIILKNIEWTVPKGELAYFVDEAFEGRGIISFAVKWLTDYAFNELKMERLYIKLNSENIGSSKVAIKNGFEKEGLLKSEFRTGHGILNDMEIFGLLKNKIKV